MKIILLFILLFINKLSISAEWITEGTAKLTILKKLELPGGSTYSSFEVTGAGKSNTGKYSTVICAGHRVDKNNILEEQKVFCNASISDGYDYSFMQIRNKTDTDAGVGKTTILSGTGPYKQLANKECIYAVSYLRDHAFVTTKCTVSDKTLNLLKK
tara:strand:+ start:318 stop:788 length:471 start_codon:yes stop_codon:yes gene_type:complete